MSKIDIDKFVCSLRRRFGEDKGIATRLDSCLRDQGVKFIDTPDGGRLEPIKPNNPHIRYGWPKPPTPKFRIGDVIQLKAECLTPDEDTKIENTRTKITGITDKYYTTNGWAIIYFGQQDSFELVEQKPVEWDESIIDETISLINKLASGYGEKVDEPITFNGVKMINNIKERLRAIKPQPQKEWSEEDNEILNKIIHYHETTLTCLATEERHNESRKWVNWLKFLKDRVQPKTEWGKEDEQFLLVCKNALSKYQVSDKWDAGIISRWLENKLKSLSPQKQWKPSEGHIKAIEDSIEFLGCTRKVREDLKSLYEQLKKLKEE